MTSSLSSPLARRLLLPLLFACTVLQARPALAIPQAPSPSLRQGFELGLGDWTAATTSGVATWHIVNHPETLAVAPGLNPEEVSLADNGAHLAAVGGTHVAWFGDDSTGTYIGADHPFQALLKNGGTSKETQSGTLTSPSVPLASGAQALLEFDSWWEIEGTATTSFDLMDVNISVDGAPFVPLATVNPTFAVEQPGYAAYSSGGPSTTPVWRHYAVDLSAYAGSSVQVQFSFSSGDTSFNAFRGFTVDNVAITGGIALPAPTLSAVSPAVAKAGDLASIRGAHFANGARFYLGTHPILPEALTQLGANTVLFQVPSLSAGTYDLQVVNPDGQATTLANAFTSSPVASPIVAATSPASATVALRQAVTLTGANFVNGATVQFGTADASEVRFVSSTELSVTAPALPAGTYNVVVTNPSSQRGTEFAAYTVTDSATLSLTAPNGGEVWTTGSQQALSWTSVGADVVSLDLYRAGTFVSHLAASVDATVGGFVWTLPADLTPASDYSVKLFNPDGTTSATSAAPFTIVAGSVAPTAPEAPPSSITTVVDTGAPAPLAAPHADDQSVTTPAGSPLSISLGASDQEQGPLTYRIQTFPAHGTLSGTGPSVIYTPAPNYSGPDAFTFQVENGDLQSSQATVSIEVTADDAPGATVPSATPNATASIAPNAASPTAMGCTAGGQGAGSTVVFFAIAGLLFLFRRRPARANA